MGSVWFWLGIAAIAYLISWGMKRSQKKSANTDVAKAKDLMTSGNWEAAAASYKKGILEVLDNGTILAPIVAELTDLYKNNGIEVDFSGVYRAPQLIKQVWDSKTPDKEKSRLTAKIYSEIEEILNRYPGKVE